MAIFARILTMPHQYPLISVIMPCFNAERHVLQSIQSVFNQTYPNLQLIVINDGSTDGSLQILQSLSDFRLSVFDQPNLGVCKSRNLAILYAKGDFIAFLDADDTWHPECLNKLFQSLIEDKSAALSYCGWQNIGLLGGAGQPYTPPNYENENKLAALFQNCLWPIHACLTHKKIIIDAGLFDESLLIAEDFLLWLKIGSKYKVIQVPEVLAFYHFHDGQQATRNKERVALDLLCAKQKFIQQNPEIVTMLGEKKIRQLIYGELIFIGFECYWKRDLNAARVIFRKIMKQRYGSAKEWIYMLPALLPFRIHHWLILLFTSR